MNHELKTIYLEDRSFTSDFSIPFTVKILDFLGYDTKTDFDKLVSGGIVPQLAILNPEAAKERVSMLRAMFQDIKIMIVIGYPLTDREFFQRGADYSLSKPFVVTTLKAKLLEISHEVLLLSNGGIAGNIKSLAASTAAIVQSDLALLSRYNLFLR